MIFPYEPVLFKRSVIKCLDIGSRQLTYFMSRAKKQCAMQMI